MSYSQIVPDETASGGNQGRSVVIPVEPVATSLSSSSDPAGFGSTGASPDASIWQQSSHPIALFFLFFFRCLAIATYVLCGFFSSSYVFSTLIVVLLLSMDFWTVRNVSGRVLVGLRFWNQVDDDGTSFWVFEHRGPSTPPNPVDARMFWIAMYTFPVAWILLFVIGLLKFNLSFLPIVALALVFNLANTVGYMYADRDAKAKWTNAAASSLLSNFLPTSIFTSLAQRYIGGLFV